MAGPITTGAHPKALWPGIHAWWGRQYNEHQEEYPMLFDVVPSEQAYEEDTEITGFGLMPVKNEGSAIVYDTEQQGVVSRYTHLAYALGYIVTYEELRDDLYEIVSKRRAQALAFSGRQTVENVCSNVYNRAFNGNYTFGDGQTLISPNHPTMSGPQSNQLTTAADISEIAIEDLVIQIMQITNSRGLRVSVLPKSIHVAPQQWFEINRILNSVLQNDTAGNATNILKAQGTIPEGPKLNHYFSSATAWFIRTNVPHGMTFFNREPATFDMDNDFDTKNAKAAQYLRFSVGLTDFRQIFGTQGV
jgi:hypothetical protein